MQIKIKTELQIEQPFENVVKREVAQKLDSLAEKYFGIPTSLLMENAGRKISDFIKSNFGKNSAVVIVAGTGNNGGDGFCVAKHLYNAGFKVHIAIIQEKGKIKGDALLNLNIIKNISEKDERIRVEETRDVERVRLLIKDSDLIIDAIFGTGLSREIEDNNILSIIDEINSSENRKNKKVISIDIPSGLDSDLGIPLPKAVRADFTITFAPAKAGLFIFPAPYYTGNIVIEDIGIPKLLWEDSQIKIVTIEIARALLRERNRTKKEDAHKGDFGRTFIIAGAVGRAGAAVLSGLGSLKVGSGLVYILTPKSVYLPVASGAKEYMVHPAEDDGQTFSEQALKTMEKLIDEINPTSIVFGPGVYLKDSIKKMLIRILDFSHSKNIPVIIDADGINALAEIGYEKIFNGEPKRLILTPHPGEMSRLLKGEKIKDIQKDRINCAKSFSERTGTITVLKGARTIISDGKRVFINLSGNQGLASGGTGDVLSGIIGGLVSQGYQLTEASILGVFLQSFSADLITNERGAPYLTAEEVARKIPEALSFII